MFERIFIAATVLFTAPAVGAIQADGKPNIVLILFDDLGYGDLGCYGSRIPTPNIDRLAAEGVRFTDFYASASYCSPSRASLLTGCYPQRVGIPSGLGPYNEFGINPNETTIAEVLKRSGYATGCVGKWHLGDAPTFSPLNHGFDTFLGLPYSHDVTPGTEGIARHYPDLALYRQDEVVEVNPDPTSFTSRYTEASIAFIDRAQGGPFFLYMAHAYPHTPLHASPRFLGRTGLGLYADVVAELDWSVGRIVRALERLGIASDTLVILTSDNGPAVGSAGPLRAGKGTTFEGGQRVPLILWQPGRLSHRVVNQVTTMMDLYPTIAAAAHADVPPNGPIDGVALWPWLDEARVDPIHESFAFYHGRELQAIRRGDWKLHFAHRIVSRKGDGENGEIPLSLFNLSGDLGETTDLAPEHPEVVADLSGIANRYRIALGDSLRGMRGRDVRSPGRVPPWEPLGRKAKAAILLTACASVAGLLQLLRHVRMRRQRTANS